VDEKSNIDLFSVAPVFYVVVQVFFVGKPACAGGAEKEAFFGAFELVEDLLVVVQVLFRVGFLWRYQCLA
jgi:hypothetical protein